MYKKLLLILPFLFLPTIAFSQSIPDWKSYLQTGNPSDIVPSAGTNNSVANWFGRKVDVESGNLNSPKINGGTISGVDISKLTALPIGANTSRTLSDHFSDVIHARDRGIMCDGVTDDAPAINAIYAKGQLHNTLLLFPAGVCVIKSKVTPQLNNSGFQGAGKGQTLFLYTGSNTTSDILFFPENTFAATIGGFDVQSTTVMTGGAAIHTQKTRYTTICDFSAIPYSETTNTLWNGLWVDQPDFTVVNNFRLWSQNAAMAVSANGAGTSYQYDVFATDGKVYGSKFGVEISGVDNAMFDNIMDTSNTYNVVVDNALADAASQELYFGPHFTSDQAKIWGLWVNDKKCQFTPNYGIIDFRGAITASGNDGVHVQNWPNCSLRLDSPHISKNGNDGIHINDASTHIAISPSTFLENNANWAVNSEIKFSHLDSMGIAIGNGLGGMNPTSILTPHMAQTQDTNVPQYTVANAPICSVNYQLGVSIYFTDALKNGERPGNGTGTSGYCTKSSSGSFSWVRVSDDAPIEN